MVVIIINELWVSMYLLCINWKRTYKETGDHEKSEKGPTVCEGDQMVLQQ